MAKYYKPGSILKFDPYIKDIQQKLNTIRLLYHGNWNYLMPDGLYGTQTGNAVKAFQEFRNITPASGELGPTTDMHINQLYNQQPKLQAVSRKECDQQDDELGKIVMNYFVEPTSKTVMDFLLGLQKDYPQNTKLFVKDWNQFVNRMRTSLLGLMSKFNTNESSVYEQINRYWEKKRKLSPNRHRKSNKYSQNIEILLNNHIGKSKIKLDYNTVSKHLKVGKVISSTGKLAGKLDLYVAIWKIGDDINSINDSSAWKEKWAKDVNDFIYVVIEIVIGTVVVLLLPEEMAFFLVCLIVGAVGVLVSWLLSCFRKTYLGQKVNYEIGEETAKFIRNWQKEMSEIKYKNKMAEEAWAKSQRTITIKIFE